MLSSREANFNWRSFPPRSIQSLGSRLINLLRITCSQTPPLNLLDKGIIADLQRAEQMGSENDTRLHFILKTLLSDDRFFKFSSH